MTNKKGITISMMATIITILIIITATVVISVQNVSDGARLRTFATELTMIKDEVDLRQSEGTDTSYMNEVIFLDVSGVTANIQTSQFSGETIDNNKITLYKLDLGKLKLDNTVYGNNKADTNNDVYAISTKTKKVYYCAGIKANRTTYYTLTDELKTMTGNKMETVNITKQVIFKPSEIGWTNKPVNVEISIPNTYTDIEISIEDRDEPITSNASCADLGDTNICNVNNITGNYTINVTYSKEGENVTETFKVNNFDNGLPVFDSMGTQSYAIKGNTFKAYLQGLKYNDALSGIKTVGYVKNVASITLEQSEMKKYIDENGTPLKGGSMIWENDANHYLFYIEDNAGNIAVASQEISNEILNARTVNGYNLVKGVNEPVLLDGMTPVVCDSKSATGDWWRNATADEIKYDSWYDYSTTSKKWANARTEDGSLWVWIPRYEYNILEEPGTVPIEKHGTINIRFISKSVNSSTRGYTTNSSGIITSLDGYTIHPAFVNETNVGYANGGWDKELAGIWVAKFQASMTDTDGRNISIITENEGNILLSDNVKLKFKAGMVSWKYCSMYCSYNNALNYSSTVKNEDKQLSQTYDSHLMKNSEWGAVIYLSGSKYGYGLNNIKENTNGMFFSGGHASLSYVYGIYKKQSTTGNVYGIYDMSGGVAERTAIFNNKYPYKDSENTIGEENMLSSKYLTAYSNDTNESAITATLYKKGDATYEIYSRFYSVGESKLWLNTLSNICDINNPYIVRGGNVLNGKILTVKKNSGNAETDVGYRVVLINK